MMSSVVMKMLTDVYMVDIQRQIEHQRVAEKASRGPWILTVAALLVAAVIGSAWIA